MKRLSSPVVAVILAALYLLAAMQVSNTYYQLIFTLVPVWACFGLSWNMLSGYTGLVSFGHAAFFGLGAYATVHAQIHWGISPWIMIPVSGLLGALAGLLVGWPTFRLRGHYFALSMLAYPLALLYVAEWLGWQEVTFPMKHADAAWYMQFSDARAYTAIATGLMLLCIFISAWVERTRFGRALIAIKQNEAAAEAAGIDTLRWKLKAIALSGAMAGAIGGFYAVVLLVVTPQSVFGMLVSAQALTVSMFGGVGTLWGPVIGAAVLTPLGELLHARLGGAYPGIQGVILGVAIIAVILLAPEGLYWKVRDWWRGRHAEAEPALDASDVATPAADVPARRAPPQGEVILDVRNIGKTFGGLRAVHDVSFQVRRGMILGIIGPNGAGKTTLFNLLNGFIAPNGGQVLLKGVDMAGRKPHVLCAAGVGRTFQVMRPFMRLSVAENVKVGAYVRATSERHAQELADAAVARLGLAAHAGRIASSLSTRELRLMELARAVAGQPEILLLDETLAGLGLDESETVVAAIRSLAAEGMTIVIIEHTMKLMVQLVDEFVVLDHGEVLVVGDPQAITQDKRVVEAYLGKKWSAKNA
ncbi:ATP-binding cassette domain-containing protein [Xylophilus rhododendri]|uniref:ATP-binding cassette domain-containing protein n=1 Tax=Xylophilus rhododendri TaxID=2697032 RepID=A0A857J6R7_9BURK|nr:branched-chain amino acid ABC transporter ATP-binding protein/permease [Xylophilus rhododendri]QHI99526.1 ATP-binding cassette domain-containing protein [Xylophilus rhododendri]